MLASNYQMPANGRNGIIVLFPWRSQESERKAKVFGSCGNESWWESSQACPDLGAEVDGMFPESCDTGDKTPATGSSQRPLWCPPDWWSSENF